MKDTHFVQNSLTGRPLGHVWTSIRHTRG